MIDLEQTHALLLEEGLAGWLLYDFKGLNPLACDAVLPEPGGHRTRRWFCYIPADGPPQWLVHAIERGSFSDVPGRVEVYAERTSLASQLRELLPTSGRVAMEYSPGANIPTISRVDAGTLELVRQLGVEVVSSGDLVQRLLAPWPRGGLEAHERAARVLEQAVRDAWASIAQGLVDASSHTSECGVQARLMAAITTASLETDHPPIVAVGPHAADPHFAPSPDADTRIGPDQVVMIDIWAREPGPAGVYADMTFMAFTGADPPQQVRAVWELVRDARDRAFALVRNRFEAGRSVRGFEVDRAARDGIIAAGYGDHFVHRTGHSLGPEGHWIGTNLDDYETHDDRRLTQNTGFTIEPGIYLPGAFGVRSEVDVFWGDAGPVITTELQRELLLLT
jgi:Xaa-Pro aminopeptidase